MAQPDLTFPVILHLFGDYMMKGRTESQAFLAWFLENYYRLEATDVDDSICDERYDKGIDGIYANDQLQQIDVFQSWLARSTEKGLGDTALKEFLGTLTQLGSADSVNHLEQTTRNKDLQSLLFRRASKSYALSAQDFQLLHIFRKIRG